MLTREAHDSELLAPLWALLADQKFRDSVEALGGYTCAETGVRVRCAPMRVRAARPPGA